MKIDPRFMRAREAERLRSEKKRKQELTDRIANIIRTSPVDLAEKICQYASTQKLELLHNM